MSIEHMAWALRLDGIPPSSKLLAIYICNYYGCGPTDPRDGFTFELESIAAFACVSSDSVDRLLKAIPNLVVIPRGKFRQVWLPEESSR